jgi:hypothetical protein
MATEKASKPAAKLFGKAGRATWIVVGVVALAFFVATELGYVGFGWAQLMAKVFPKDQSLLEYIPGETTSLLIVDPHLLDPKAVGQEGSAPRAYLARAREDVKKATGIDLLFDVDKIALSPVIAVSHGRFDGKALSDKLMQSRYAAVDHKGHTYLVRAGEDAIAVVGDALVLYGDEAGVKAAFDAHDGGSSIAKDEAVTARLERAGWAHPFLATARFSSERPSIRDVLTGSTGPRSATLAAATPKGGGLELTVTVEAASPAAAEEMQRLIEDKRKGEGPLAPTLGQGPAPDAIAAIVKSATVSVDPPRSAVIVRARATPEQIDAITKVASSPGAMEMYKALRLYQLLTP